MDINEIIAYAKKFGYDTAYHLCKWKGYECYTCDYDTDTKTIEGYPTFLLVKNNRMRRATLDETGDIMRAL